MQDDPSPLDWKNWTFLEQTAKANFYPQGSNLSVFKNSVEPLNFDKLHRTFSSSGASIPRNVLSCSDQPSIQPQNLQEILPEDSALLGSRQTCFQMPEAKVVRNDFCPYSIVTFLLN